MGCCSTLQQSIFFLHDTELQLKDFNCLKGMEFI